MSELVESVVKTIKEFERLPGIGKKTAERIVYHLLKIPNEKVFLLSDSIRFMKENVRYCSRCFNLAENELCDICRDVQRNQDVLCVVEQPRDLIALEKTGQYHGIYHVLLGRVSPLDGVGPEQLTIEELIRRIKMENIKEVIMATNPTVEGDGTVLAISNRLKGIHVRISRLARGVTTGSLLEYANNEMLVDAILERQFLND